MDHDRALELYEAYFSGHLDRATVKEFHAHLNDCEDCKVRMRVTRASVSGFRGVRKSQDDDAMNRILSRNRTITYVVLVIMICFFFLLKLRLFQRV